MKLKGIELKGTYKVRFEDNCSHVLDEKGNPFYSENSDGYWTKREYDKNGNIINFEDSSCLASKAKYDEKDNIIYYENNQGYWIKQEFDEQGNRIYYEDSNGYIIDKRVKELTVKEIEKLLGYKIKVKGE